MCCHAQGGAANNWAYGYHAHGATFTEACLEAFRRETERCGNGREKRGGGGGQRVGGSLVEIRFLIAAVLLRAGAPLIRRGWRETAYESDSLEVPVLGSLF